MVHIKIEEDLVKKVRIIVNKKKPLRKSNKTARIVREGLMLLIEQNQDVLKNTRRRV
ncbi:MAG: hypothetical protein ACTSRI_02760 [Promethearchaeota archaeon]